MHGLERSRAAEKLIQSAFLHFPPCILDINNGREAEPHMDNDWTMLAAWEIPKDLRGLGLGWPSLLVTQHRSGE